MDLKEINDVKCYNKFARDSILFQIKELNKENDVTLFDDCPILRLVLKDKAENY